MNNVLKYIVGTLIAAIALVCIALALASADHRKKEQVFTGITIENDSPQGRRFLEDEELIALVKQYNGNIVGRKVCTFNTDALEKDLDNTSCILKSQVYADKEGVLHIQVSERKPFVRLQTAGGGFYADREGKLFPLQSHYCAWVPVVEGKLPIGHTDRKAEQKWIESLITWVAAFQDSPKWKNRCTQIHIDKDGLATLCLDGFSERFLLGDFTEVEKKQRKIEQYISLIRPQLAGGKTYKSVNVRFNGQIICQ